MLSFGHVSQEDITILLVAWPGATERPLACWLSPGPTSLFPLHTTSTSTLWTTFLCLFSCSCVRMLFPFSCKCLLHGWWSSDAYGEVNAVVQWKPISCGEADGRHDVCGYSDFALSLSVVLVLVYGLTDGYIITVGSKRLPVGSPSWMDGPKTSVTVQGTSPVTVQCKSSYFMFCCDFPAAQNLSEVCFMSGTTATVVVNRLSQEVLLLHFGATAFYEDSSVLFPWTSNIAPVTVLPIVNILSRAVPKMFLSVRKKMHGRMSALSFATERARSSVNISICPGSCLSPTSSLPQHRHFGPFVDNSRHSGDEIDLAGSEGLGSKKVDNISPRWLSQSAQDVPVAPMSCLTLAITEVFSRIDHKAKVCLKILLFVSRGVRTPCLGARMCDEALRDICRRNLDIKRKHTPL